MEATARRFAAPERDAQALSAPDRALPAVDITYRSLLADLVGFCSRRCPDTHTAEDIAQETFLRAVVHARATGDVPRWPWLQVTATRLLRDMAIRDVPVETTNGSSIDTVESAEDTAVTRDDVAWLEATLTGLSPMQREALLLEDGGWSTREVARWLHTTEANVRQARRRARARLREGWSERGRGVLLFPMFGWDGLRAWAARWRQRLLPSEAGSVGPVAEALGGVAAATLVTVMGIGLVATSSDIAAGAEQDPTAVSVLSGHLANSPAVASAAGIAGDGADDLGTMWLDPAVEIPGSGTKPSGDVASTNFSVGVRAGDVPAANDMSVIEATNPRASVQATESDESTRTLDQSALVDGTTGPIGIISETPIYCEGLTGSTLCTAYDTVVPVIDAGSPAPPDEAKTP